MFGIFSCPCFMYPQTLYSASSRLYQHSYGRDLRHETADLTAQVPLRFNPVLTLSPPPFPPGSGAYERMNTCTGKWMDGWMNRHGQHMQHAYRSITCCPGTHVSSTSECRCCTFVSNPSQPITRFLQCQSHVAS